MVTYQRASFSKPAVLGAVGVDGCCSSEKAISSAKWLLDAGDSCSYEGSDIENWKVFVTYGNGYGMVTYDEARGVCCTLGYEGFDKRNMFSGIHEDAVDEVRKKGKIQNSRLSHLQILAWS